MRPARSAGHLHGAVFVTVAALRVAQISADLVMRADALPNGCMTKAVPLCENRMRALVDYGHHLLVEAIEGVVPCGRRLGSDAEAAWPGLPLASGSIQAFVSGSREYGRNDPGGNPHSPARIRRQLQTTCPERGS